MIVPVFSFVSCWVLLKLFKLILREKCPSTKLFLVRIQENTDQKWLCIWTLLTQCWQHPSTAVLKTIKSVILAFFGENLSRTEVAKYLAFVSSNGKFYWKHFLMKSYIINLRWWVPVNEFFEFWLQLMCYSLKYSNRGKLFCMPCSSCVMVY